jgi:hypothetical protein
MLAIRPITRGLIMNFLSNVLAATAGYIIGRLVVDWWQTRTQPKPVTLVFRGGKITFGGFMFVVPADHGDVSYSVTLPTSATDSEGNAVPLNPDLFSVTVESDNPAAVEILPDDDGDNLSGTVRFGGPGPTGEPALANVNAVVHYDGRMVASYGAQFTVVAGDAQVFGGGGIAFDGIEEVPSPDDEPVDDGGLGDVDEDFTDDEPV